MNDDELLKIIFTLAKQLSPEGRARAALHFQPVAAGFMLDVFDESQHCIVPLHSASIIRIKTGHNHFKVYTMCQNGKIVAYKVKEPLNKYEWLLKHPDFMQVHRFHVIHFLFLTEFRKKGILMAETVVVPATRKLLLVAEKRNYDYRKIHPV